MELVRGVKITDYCNEHRHSTRERLVLFMQVCHAVQHAHQKGIIHRDIKPSNILVTRLDGAPVPKVIDLGIAKATEQPLTGHTSLTAFQQFIGTPAYMSPEQAEMGPQDIDTRSDIYTLGVLLYELLTGQVPFEKKALLQAGFDEMRRLIREQEPPKPSTRLATALAATPQSAVRTPQLKEVRGDLDWIVMKCLEKDRARRYETASGLAQDVLRHLSNEPVTAAAPSALYRTGKFIRRHRAALAMATVLALLVAAGVATLAIARGFQVERDTARQITALRSAELAARSGQWRQALKHWRQAEAAGYNNEIDLGLQRAEAWTVLSEPALAEAELRRLAKRSDLGNQAGPVLLRLGEHELFDAATASRGVQHVREALATGLDAADDLFARGLLADSTPEALDLFHQAIKINSFHHRAHRHSLGLEFLLGRHSELQDSLRFFAAIYPDDPSAGFLEAAELAMQGRLEEARARMVPLRPSVGLVEWTQLNDSLPLFATAAKRFDPDVLLAASRPALPSLDFFTAAERISGIGGAASTSSVTLRMPYLPSIQKGLLEGRAAVAMMMLPSIGNIDTSVARIKTSWQHHPEALVPVFAGFYLETRQPTNGPKSIHLLKLQAELFQLAADSPSILAGLDRTSRYLAAKTEFELLQSDPTNAASLRKSCLANIRQALSSPETSVAEFKACFNLVMKLGDYDLARALIARWEHQQPLEALTSPYRIELEIAAGNLDAAWKLVNRALAASPNDARALAERATIQQKLAELIDLIYNSAEFSPFPGKL
jgi:tRNA A-37 threonylcarbamoyl transferase component Bud32